MENKTQNASSDAVQIQNPTDRTHVVSHSQTPTWAPPCSKKPGIIVPRLKAPAAEAGARCDAAEARRRGRRRARRSRASSCPGSRRRQPRPAHAAVQRRRGGVGAAVLEGAGHRHAQLERPRSTGDWFQRSRRDALSASAPEAPQGSQHCSHGALHDPRATAYMALATPWAQLHLRHPKDHSTAATAHCTIHMRRPTWPSRRSERKRTRHTPRIAAPQLRRDARIRERVSTCTPRTVQISTT